MIGQKTLLIVLMLLFSVSETLTVKADELVVPYNAFTGGFGPSTPYRGQTFKGVSGLAEQLTVFMNGSSDPPGIDFRILLAEMDTTAGIHPSKVIFESNILHVPEDPTRKIFSFSIDLEDIPLKGNQTYAIVFECTKIGWIIDVINAAIGIDVHGSYQKGVIFNPIEMLPPWSTRADYFDGLWESSDETDLAFRLTFSPQPSSDIFIPLIQILLLQNYLKY
jgi:hypothetical protein